MATTKRVRKSATPATRRRFVKKVTHAEIANMNAIEQVERAFAPGRKIAAVMGMLLGGFVPVAVFLLVHFEVGLYPVLWLLVGGGLLYSAISVFKWAKLAFGLTAKAAGFVILLEGVVTFSHHMSLSIAGLLFLIAINGISAAVNLQATPVADRDGL